MSHKRVMKTLASLGLSKIETSVYLYIATDSPQKVSKIIKALKLQEPLIYQSLEKLRGKGIVSFVREPDLFSALPFEKALELLMKAHLKEAQAIEENRNELLSKWKRIVSQRSKD